MIEIPSDDTMCRVNPEYLRQLDPMIQYRNGNGGYSNVIPISSHPDYQPIPEFLQAAKDEALATELLSTEREE